MSKYDFHESYPGPIGPHLHCLTNFTRTRDETKRGGESIHPRSWFGSYSRGGTGKQAICKPKQPTTTARTVAALANHCDRHPNDRQSASHLAWLKASS